MALLTRSKKTNETASDWRDDPTLATALEKARQLEAKMTPLGLKLAQAEADLHAAAEALEDALLNELLERGSAQEVQAARTKYAEAKETYEQCAAQHAQLERARTLLREEMAPLEDEAKRRALARLIADYAVRVRELGALLTQAESVNAEVDSIYRAMKQCAPEREPWAVPEVNLAWPELRFNPNHDDGGKLGHWRKRAEEVMHG